MAQARQEVEEYWSSMMACLDEHGIAYQVSGGGEVLVLLNDGPDGTPVPGEDDRIDAGRKTCNERVPLPSLWSWTPDDGAYQRMLDVRECLVAQGYEVQEPPSEQEAYSEPRESRAARYLMPTRRAE